MSPEERQRITAPHAEAPRRVHRPRITYVVEVAPVANPDPKVAARVLAWMRARVK